MICVWGSWTHGERAIGVGGGGEVERRIKIRSDGKQFDNPVRGALGRGFRIKKSYGREVQQGDGALL